MIGLQLQEKLMDIEKLRSKVANDVSEGKKAIISDKSLNLMENVTRNMYGDFSKGKVSMTEALTTTDVTKLIPKVIEGKIREASEPQYLATNFFDTINVDGGNSAVYVIPVVGEVIAEEVGEGSTYHDDNPDFNTVENGTFEIRVKKIGSKVVITEEAIADSSWDILGLNIKKMGKAMGRYKEEQCFNNFSNGGHLVFDNSLREQAPEFSTNGRGQDGTYNDTLAVEDLLDMTLTLMSNGFNPTDIIMHPLTWLIFAKNSMIGNGLTFGAFGGNNVHPWGAVQGTPGFGGLASNGNGQKMIIRPEQVDNRLPVPITINFSPWIKFDKVQKRFDMYCLDRDNIGVIAQREKLTTESWTNPERDIRNLKCKERYGIGLLNDGKAITVAKNLAVAPTYPVPPEITIKNVNNQ